jgi:hypothetical protein
MRGMRAACGTALIDGPGSFPRCEGAPASSTGPHSALSNGAALRLPQPGRGHGDAPRRRRLDDFGASLTDRCLRAGSSRRSRLRKPRASSRRQGRLAGSSARCDPHDERSGAASRTPIVTTARMLDVENPLDLGYQLAGQAVPVTCGRPGRFIAARASRPGRSLRGLRLAYSGDGCAAARIASSSPVTSAASAVPIRWKISSAWLSWSAASAVRSAARAHRPRPASA